MIFEKNSTQNHVVVDNVIRNLAAGIFETSTSLHLTPQSINALHESHELHELHEFNESPDYNRIESIVLLATGLNRETTINIHTSDDVTGALHKYFKTIDDNVFLSYVNQVLSETMETDDESKNKRLLYLSDLYLLTDSPPPIEVFKLIQKVNKSKNNERIV